MNAVTNADWQKQTHPPGGFFRDLTKLPRFAPNVGVARRRRRCSPAKAHKSRIHEVLASGKAPGAKRKWR